MPNSTAVGAKDTPPTSALPSHSAPGLLVLEFRGLGCGHKGQGHCLLSGGGGWGQVSTYMPVQNLKSSDGGRELVVVVEVMVTMTTMQGKGGKGGGECHLQKQIPDDNSYPSGHPAIIITKKLPIRIQAHWATQLSKQSAASPLSLPPLNPFHLPCAPAGKETARVGPQGWELRVHDGSSAARSSGAAQLG